MNKLLLIVYGACTYARRLKGRTGLPGVLWTGVVIFSLLLPNTAFGLYKNTTILSTGEISYAGALPELRVVGKYIVDKYNKPVHLFGCLGVLKCLYYNDEIFHSRSWFEEAKNLGMQIVRIGIDMGRYVTAPYTYDDSFFTQSGGLDDVLDWCEDNDVKAIVHADFTIHFGDYFTYAEGHGFPAYMTPPEHYTNDQAGMYKAWKDLWRGTPPLDDALNQLYDAWLHVVQRYKDRQIIVAWDVPVDEPSVGDWMEPSEVNPLYYGFVRRLIDGIRTIDPHRLIIVETLDSCTWGLTDYNEDIGRPNTAYNFHSYAAGWDEKYDPTLSGVAQGDVWNKAGLEKWIQDNVVDGLLNRFNRPVVMLGSDHLTGLEYGDWLQYYWDLYEILDRVGVWVSTGFRACGGVEYGLWDQYGNVKPQAEVLTYWSSHYL